MDTFDLTVWWAPVLAFAAGVVAFASPCVLPLVPGYLSFVTAANAPAGGRSTRPAGPVQTRAHLVPMLLFVAGFAVVFTSLGAFAGIFVPFVRSAAGQRIAGAIVLVVGVFMVLYAFRLGSARLYTESRPLLSRMRPGKAAALPLGMAFAAGWTPCIGPVLAGILALATTQGSPARSALLLFVFSLGLGLPFVLIGLGVGRLFDRLGFLQRRYHAIAGVSGVVMIAIGALLISGAWVRVLSPLLQLVSRFQPPL